MKGHPSCAAPLCLEARAADSMLCTRHRDAVGPLVDKALSTYGDSEGRQTGAHLRARMAVLALVGTVLSVHDKSINTSEVCDHLRRVADLFEYLLGRGGPAGKDGPYGS